MEDWNKFCQPARMRLDYYGTWLTWNTQPGENLVCSKIIIEWRNMAFDPAEMYIDYSEFEILNNFEETLEDRILNDLTLS